MHGRKTQKEIRELFKYSKSYISKLLGRLEHKGFIKRVKENKKYIVDYNLDNLLVSKFNELLLLSINRTEFIDIFMKKRVIKVLSCFKPDIVITLEVIAVKLKYSKPIIIDALKELEKQKIVARISQKPVEYKLNESKINNLLQEISAQLVSFEKIDLMKYLLNEKSVRIIIQYGSSITPEYDKYSDTDIFVVVDIPQDKKRIEEIVDKSPYSKLHLNILSKLGFSQKIKKEPYFVKLIKEGKILKGRDIVEELWVDV